MTTRSVAIQLPARGALVASVAGATSALSAHCPSASSLRERSVRGLLACVVPGAETLEGREPRGAGPDGRCSTRPRSRAGGQHADTAGDSNDVEARGDQAPTTPAAPLRCQRTRRGSAAEGAGASAGRDSPEWRTPAGPRRIRRWQPCRPRGVPERNRGSVVLLGAGRLTLRAQVFSGNTQEAVGDDAQGGVWPPALP